MAKKWSEVIQSEEYQALPHDKKIDAQGAYFREVVAPQVPQEKRQDAFKAFMSEYPVPVRDPTAEMSGVQKFAAGYGGALPNIVRGVGQITGLVDQSSVDETKRLEAPLMKTGAGFAGNVLGHAAAALPAAFIPGANSYLGASAIGAGMGFLQPVATGESRLMNTAWGGIGGAVGQGIGRGIGYGVKAAKDKIGSLASSSLQNASRDSTITAAQNAGYALPPSFSGGGVLKRVLEGIAGKASVKQGASEVNQKATEKLVRSALGVGDDVPLSPQLFGDLKKGAWDVYDEVRSIGSVKVDKQFIDDLTTAATTKGRLGGNSKIDALAKKLKSNSTADDVVNDIMQLRSNANTRLSKLNTDPASRSLGQAEKKMANALEDLLERRLNVKSFVSEGDEGVGTNLLDRFRAARTTLAKVNDVEKSMSKGSVDMRKLAKSSMGKLDKNIKVGADFAKSFPELNQGRVSQILGGTPLDVFGSLGISAYTQDPRYLALMALRPAARKAVLSKMMQSNPSYAPGLLTQGMSKMSALESSKLPAGLGLLGPSIYAAKQ